MGFVVSLKTNPKKHILTPRNSGSKTIKLNSYAMPIVTPDIFSPPPSNWLRPEVKMTIPESCEMQKKKLCQVRFSIFLSYIKAYFTDSR